jgi:hypothetical protein
MKTIIKTTIIIAFISLTLLGSCKKSEDAKVPIDNTPQEQITTVLLRGYNKNNPADSNYFIAVKWEDLDGNGGNAPIIDSLLLDTGITYSMNLVLLDKTKTPVDTISNEVLERGSIHQLFYTPSSSLLAKVIVERLDKDNNSPALPIGLQTQWNILTIPSYTLPVLGTVNLVLSHYDGIPKTALPSPESDIDVTFPVRLK